MGAGVMVVERAGDQAGDIAATLLLPALVAVAEPGLRGDREGVAAALLRLERGALAGCGAEVVERLRQLVSAFDAEVEAAVTGLPSRHDVLASMLRLGTLSESEYLAGVELRAVAQVLTQTVAVQAMDPTKPVVDASAVWRLPAPSDVRSTLLPMIKRADRWAEYLGREARSIKSRRGGKGPAVETTVLALVHRVVQGNEPLSELDRSLRVRKGTCAMAVKAALTLYAQMNSACFGEG